MSDSDTPVNSQRLDRFRFVAQVTGNLPEMPSNRDDVVSGFVRFKIREWRESGRELQDLARLAGFAKSTPSQVIMGTGVGQKTGPKFARAFGFESYDAMKLAAFEWWKSQTVPGEGTSAEPVVAQAVDAVVALNQGTRQQVEAVLTAYAHPRFRGRELNWWITTLLDELGADRRALKADKAERIEAAAGQRVFREAGRQKRAPKAAASKPSKRQRAG